MIVITRPFFEQQTPNFVIALHFHEAKIEGLSTWQASVSLPTGKVFLFDAYQGSKNTFIGSKVESEIVRVHGSWETGQTDMPLIVQALDIETVETVDPGCNLVAAVVNFLYSYKTNFYEVCSTNSKGQALKISWLPPSKNWISASSTPRSKKEKSIIVAQLQLKSSLAVSCQCTLTK